MCGIGGYIGKSNNPKLTYEIITNLFRETEVRGTDAAGYWGANSEGKVIYHKRPIKSSEFIKNEFWSDVMSFNPTLLITHCRGASEGDPACNKNNHPFTSKVSNTSLIHNGTLSEYKYLKNLFQVNTECDSEILLRIIESIPYYNKELLDNYIDCRLQGIKNLISLIRKGHMAVVIADNFDNQNFMWVFRNKYRPMWVIDLKSSLNQYFFCSTPKLWEKALRQVKSNIRSHERMFEVPVDEVLLIQDTITRFKIQEGNEFNWNEEYNAIKTNVDKGDLDNKYIRLLELIKSVKSHSNEDNLFEVFNALNKCEEKLEHFLNGGK